MFNKNINYTGYFIIYVVFVQLTGICLRDLLQHRSRYINTVVDSRSGNRSVIPPADTYLKSFNALRWIFYKNINEKIIKSLSPLSLWFLQTMKRTGSRRKQEEILLDTDNFYTVHFLSREIKIFTERGVRFLKPVHQLILLGQKCL